MNRRDMLKISAAGLAAGAAATALTGCKQEAPATAAAPATGAAPADQIKQIELKDFNPKSMLKTKVTEVQKAKFPFLDWHTHITHGTGLKPGDGISWSATADKCLPVMDAVNLKTMLNVTGGYGAGNKEVNDKLVKPNPGRFITFTEPAYNLYGSDGFAKKQADLIQEAHNNGSKGLKVLKTLGLFLKDHVDTGSFVKVDDPAFDPMWDACGQLNMPIAIHTGEPAAFFEPFDNTNERWEEMAAHDNTRFYNTGRPSARELQEARRRVMRKHPNTKFVCLHVAVAEDLDYVSEMLDEHKNMSVDIAARVGELGRQPRRSKKFFDKYQDRIVFGTDASWGAGSPQQFFCEDLYRIYFRFLETEDEYFEYCPPPAKHPVQGRWNISGIGLSDSVLKKVYWDNAAKLLKL